MESALLTELKSGKYGDLNVNVPVAIYTHYSSEVRLDSLDHADGFFGVFDKSDGPYQLITEMRSRLLSVPGLVAADGKPLLPDSIEQAPLIVKFRHTSEETLKLFAADPELLYKLTPRQFEEVTADIFERNGFEVVLTPAGSDRGVDIYAARHDILGSLLYVVECKRYTPPYRVGPALVRQLRGVVDRERASCGVLVTTSTFTPGAIEEQRTTPYRLALHDLQAIAGWLRRGSFT